MEEKEIKEKLEQQAKLVKDARELLEKRDSNDALVKETLEKMKNDFAKYEEANQELVEKMEKERAQVEEMNSKVALLEKQMHRMPEGGENAEQVESKKAFMRYMKERPLENVQYSMDEMESKYLRTDLAAAGGVLVPETLSSELIKQEIEVNPILANSRVINSTVKSINIPIRTTLPTAYTPGEGGTTTASNSNYKTVRLEAYRVDTITPITREELNFAAFNMESEMTSDAALELSRKINYDFLLGDGVSKSEGIMTNANVGTYTSTTTTANIVLDDFYKIQGKTYIKDIYARMGKFYMNSDTIFDLATRVTGTGIYIWQQNGAVGLPSTIAGKPYVSTPDMPSIGSSTYPVFFGDLRRAYYIINAVGIEVVIDPYSAKAQGIIEYQWIQFIGGKVALAEAIVKMRCKA